MKLLLDTHAFIWWDLTPNKLSELVRQSFVDGDDTFYLSHVSIWEMQIKQQLGKLSLRLA
jgi:PIN domain nuclease of toxin-antitoxin system